MAFERIVIFILVCILAIHTVACIWIFIHHDRTFAAEQSQETEELTTWVTVAGYEGLDDFQLYTAAIYFTVTTFTTVGYGDLSAKNHYERILSCGTMIVGVIAFSYATGAASSLISNDDARKALYQKKMHTLNKINE